MAVLRTESYGLSPDGGDYLAGLGKVSAAIRVNTSRDAM